MTRRIADQVLEKQTPIGSRLPVRVSMFLMLRAWVGRATYAKARAGVLMTAKLLVELGVNFFWVGLLGFGGGFGMIPLMKSVVTGHHWLSLAAFDQAIAIGQITPGPVAISAAFIGERVAGTWGALVATVAVFLPSLVVVVGLTRVFHRIRDVPGVRHVLGATLAGVIGLIGAVTIELGRALITNALGVAFAGVVVLLTLRWKVPYWLVVLIAAAVGSLLFRPT